MPPRINQMPLDLQSPVSFEFADFIISQSNMDAVSYLENWQNWPHHFAAIVGPQASGKSHLLHGWAAEVDAEILKPGFDLPSLRAHKIYVFDDINQRDESGAFVIDDQTLFHLYNWISEIGARIVVTDGFPPNSWLRALPDLKSRLGTVPVARIGEPDDELLLVLMVKLFSDKQLQVDIPVIHYAISRMERSFAAAHGLVNVIDKTTLAAPRKITKVLVRDCLDSLEQ